MSPLYLYNGKLLRVGDALASNIDCCCEIEIDICCWCGEINRYVGGSKDKSFAGVNVPVGGWDCIGIYKLPNGEIVTQPFPPPGGVLQGYQCEVVFACRTSDMAWAGNAPFPNGVNQGTDVDTNGEWSKAGRFSFCSNKNQEECESCRDDNLENVLNDICGTFHPNLINKKCCDFAPPDGQNCFCDI